MASSAQVTPFQVLPRQLASSAQVTQLVALREGTKHGKGTGKRLRRMISLGLGLGLKLRPMVMLRIWLWLWVIVSDLGAGVVLDT